MPGSAERVVLDASVLYPIILCDTLLRCADAGLFQPRWSVDILAELLRNLQSRIGLERAQRRIADMQSAFPRAATTGYRHLIAEMTNHPKDRHVLAAAVVAGASVVVTHNLRDFPRHTTEPHRVEVQHPDAFLMDLYEAQPAALHGIIERQAADRRNPPESVAAVLRRLALHAPRLVNRMESELR